MDRHKGVASGDRSTRQISRRRTADASVRRVRETKRGVAERS
jgi:hypothetical protein